MALLGAAEEKERVQSTEQGVESLPFTYLQYFPCRPVRQTASFFPARPFPLPSPWATVLFNLKGLPQESRIPFSPPSPQNYTDGSGII